MDDAARCFGREVGRAECRLIAEPPAGLDRSFLEVARRALLVPQQWRYLVDAS